MYLYFSYLSLSTIFVQFCLSYFRGHFVFQSATPSEFGKPHPYKLLNEKMTSISEQDQLLLINSLLPQEIGQIFKQKVSYTCLDVTDRLLAVGSEQGHVWILDTSAKKIIKEFSVRLLVL